MSKIRDTLRRLWDARPFRRRSGENDDATPPTEEKSGIRRRFRLRRSWIIGIVLVVLLAVGGIFLAGRGRRAERLSELEDSVRSSLISQGNLLITINATGNLEPVREAELPFLARGDVVDIFVQVGDVVEQGDVLASLDTELLRLDLRDAELTHQLQEIALKELESGPTDDQLEVAKAALYLAQTRLNQAAAGPDEFDRAIAELQIEMARNQLYRDQTARDIGVETSGTQGEKDFQEGLGDATIDGAEIGIQLAEVRQEQLLQGPSAGQVATARAQVVAAQASLDNLIDGADRYDLAIAQKQVDLVGLSVDLAQDTMQDAEIRAPFAGTVATVNIDIGEPVQPGVPVITVIDEEVFQLELDVDEVDITNVRIEQPVEVTFDALPGQVVTGRVERIAPTATETNGVVTYDVLVTLDETDAPLRAGMTGTALITVDQLDSALLVPNWAVRIDRRTGDAFVSVRTDDGLIEEVSVSIGLRNDAFSQVLSGLDSGDEVVVSEDRGEFSLFGGGEE